MKRAKKKSSNDKMITAQTLDRPRANGSRKAPLAEAKPAQRASHREMIEQLAGSEMFQEYQRAFSDLTGLPLALRPLDFWQLPLHKCSHENPLCRAIAANTSACAGCLELQARLTEAARDTSAALTCPLGLVDIAVPVHIGGELQAFLYSGQVLPQPPSPERFRRALHRLREWGVEASVAELQAVYTNAAVLNRRQLEALMRLLDQFAAQLSAHANEILLRERHAEPPLILRAKKFIDARFTEPIALEAIAGHLHVSTFYFCKQFKKHTGLCFTEYLTRRRIEHTKNLLRDPHVRVSEAAFDAGFLSLPHFNRSFKRVTGQTPTGYREALP